MKLRLTRSGGHLGTARLLADVDTHRLGTEQRAAIEAAVNDARLFELKGELTPGVVSPDGYGYELAAEADDGRLTTISFAWSGAPEEVRVIANLLRRWR
jgi:hypothetical protein